MDPLDRQQIETEFALLKSIDHANVMKSYQLIKLPQQYLVISELINGSTLTEFIKRQLRINDNLEELLDPKQIYKELKPQENSPDIRFAYHSVMRKLLASKIPAIAAKLHQQEKTVIDFCRSSAFSVSGLNEIMSVTNDE